MMPRRHRNHVVASTQQSLQVAVRRAPRINDRIIPCIDCSAGIGEDCISTNGVKTRHVSRIRLAVRKLKEDAQHELDCENAACEEGLHEA
jgi:hypothetical protein